MPIFDGYVPESFARSFATWIRLEPRSRSEDVTPGLEARTADPLWLLGRQWQLGEFAAEDAGSPIRAAVTYHSKNLRSLQLTGGLDPVPLESAPPVEVAVEQEAPPVDGWRFRVEAGQQFERLLKKELREDAGRWIKRFREAFPVMPLVKPEATDEETMRFFLLLEGRAIDGTSLIRQLSEEAGVVKFSEQLGIKTDTLRRLAAALREWFADRWTAPTSAAYGRAWQTERLAYDFKLEASGGQAPLTLVARDQRSGDFDWHCVTQSASAAQAQIPGGDITATYLPTAVHYDGMPNPRWWTFEDGAVNFGRVDASTTELGKLVFLEFALIHGNDWFQLPLVVDTGTLTWIQKIVVTDVFGVETTIEAGEKDPGDRWAIFRVDAPNGEAGSYLFVPPAQGYREESAPLEEVHFVRDESANMVWAVEHIVQNGLGEPVPGAETHGRQDESRSNKAGGVLRYRLATDVPENWIPFMPARLNDRAASVNLYRGRVWRREVHMTGDSEQTQTRILSGVSDSDRLVTLREEVIPRTGLRVLLNRQRVRAPDGTTHVWLGRKVIPVARERSSGLRFDVLEPRHESEHD